MEEDIISAGLDKIYNWKGQEGVALALEKYKWANLVGLQVIMDNWEERAVKFCVCKHVSVNDE